MVPDFRRDDVWMPPYQVRGGLLKSGMTEKAVYGQTLIKISKFYAEKVNIIRIISKRVAKLQGFK
jgi:hypothetical protein